MEEKPRNYSTVLRFIAILLLLTLAMNGYSIVATYQRSQIQAQRAATYQERVEAAQRLLDQQREFIAEVFDNYHKDAYEDPMIERIAEQQLRASEYQLLVLQTIALQNSQMIALLSTVP